MFGREYSCILIKKSQNQVPGTGQKLSFYIYRFMSNHSETEPRNAPRKTWQHPWGYRESFMVVLELVLLGLIFEVLSGGSGAPLPEYPVNILAGILLPILLAGLYLLFRRHPLIKWLSSVPAAISAIAFFAAVVLLLGFIPQGNPDTNRYMHLMGLSHIKNSWLMMVSGFYFLITLGMVTIRRARTLTRRNLGFLLNHAGLWITIASGYLGSGDLVRLNIQVIEGQEAISTGWDTKTGNPVPLPFSLVLEDFDIEEYPPKIAVVDGRSGSIVSGDGRSSAMVDAGMEMTSGEWEIRILDFLPAAVKGEGGYLASGSAGAAPAAFISILNPSGGGTIAGWVSCGSYKEPYNHIPLDQHHFLAMLQPEPKKYSSDILMEVPGNSPLSATLEVNKPFRHSGWKLYQLSYDERMGKWSRLSVIEAVRDPWLPLVYAGIFLLMGGAAFLFWMGREMKGD